MTVIIGWANGFYQYSESDPEYLVQLLLPDGTWMTTSCPPEKISEQRRDCPDDTYRIVKLVVEGA